MTLDPAPSPPRPFRAGKALLSLGLVLLFQIAGGVLVAIVAIAVLGSGGGPSLPPQVAAPLLLGSGLASVVGTAAAVGLWARDLARDRTRDGLGLFLPPTRVTAAWAVAGASVAGAFIAVSLLFPPGPGATDESFMSQVVAGGGLGKLSWAVFAVVFAPLYEEILFRGLLWKGLAASWGNGAAGIVVTAVFTALHYSEVKDYWPAALSIGALAVVALASRIRTGSLAPAIAVHVAYNGAIVALAYIQD